MTPDPRDTDPLTVADDPPPKSRWWPSIIVDVFCVVIVIEVAIIVGLVIGKLRQS